MFLSFKRGLLRTFNRFSEVTQKQLLRSSLRGKSGRGNIIYEKKKPKWERNKPNK